MSEIGYGQCKQQACTMVKRLLDKNGRSSPFPNNLPEGLAVCFLKNARSGTTLSAQD